MFRNRFLCDCAKTLCQKRPSPLQPLQRSLQNAPFCEKPKPMLRLLAILIPLLCLTLLLPRDTLCAQEPLQESPADPELMQKLAEEEKAQNAKPAPDPDFASALEMAMPLSPEEIWRARDLREAVENAQSPLPAKMCMESRNLSLIPKGVPQIVRLTHGYSSTLVFQDLTGKPWPILHTVLGNPQAFSTLSPGLQAQKIDGNSHSSQSSRENAKESSPKALAKDVASEPLEDSDAPKSQNHMLNIVPLTARANSNLAIALEDAPYPIIVQLITDSPRSAKRSQDALIVFRLDQKGPLSRSDEPFLASQSLNSSESLAFIHNDPPKEAARLCIKPDLADTRLWKLGQSRYLRTPHALVWPAWKSVTNAEHIRVYELGQSPSLVLSVHGQNTTLTVTESNDD
ncbi:MAG: DotH/IcmK family type IV secretion protein [Desulfovibrio sp.]|nr:DotH/IcmK family type IV secretion protein [Desulfovibrio sp.]